MNIDDIKQKIKEIHEKINTRESIIFADDFPLSLLDVDNQMMYLRILYDQYCLLQQQCVSRIENIDIQEIKPIPQEKEIVNEDKEPKHISTIKMPSLFDFEEDEKEELKTIPSDTKNKKTEEMLQQTSNHKTEIKNEDTKQQITDESTPLDIIHNTHEEIDNLTEKNMEKEIPIEIDIDNIEFVEVEDEDDIIEIALNSFEDNFFPQINPMIEDKEPDIALPSNKINVQPHTQTNIQTQQKESLAEKYINEKQELNTQFSAVSENNMASKFQKNQINDLMKSIDINDKFLFIRELFNGNGSLFTETVNQLNQFSKLTDAIDFMEKTKTTHRWKENSDAYMRLYELLLKKYTNKN